MSRSLLFLAGSQAIRTIREQGLRPEKVKVVLGAAGGPKWLVLQDLDRLLFTAWFQDRTEPLFLLGSSIGAWRFAAISQSGPLEALDRFLSAYLAQSYSPNPSPRDISLEASRVLAGFLSSQGANQILNHPFLRLCVVAARCLWPVASDNRILLSLGLMDALIYNAVYRGALRFFFERILFCDSRDPAPFLGASDLPTRAVCLSPRNLPHALMASGAVPLVMASVRDIPDAPRGTYRDGGVLDYHFDLPFLGSDGDPDDLVLFPHYTHRVVPGWFDKHLPWRRPRASHMDAVLLIAPSEEFLERLPYRKIPDRTDFHFFKGRDQDRVAYWSKVVEMSKALSEEFWEAVETGRIRELVEPIPGSS